MSGGSQKLFQGMDQGYFGQAQKFANQGQWGQAAQAYQQGGGQFGQPQMQAFSQQYGNMFPQSQSAFKPTGPTQWAGPDAFYPNWNDDPSSGYANDVAIMPRLPVPSGQASQPQPIGEYISNDSWIPPQQAVPPPAQPQPTAPSYLPPPGFVPRPPPQMSAPQTPNWASYVQGNPDLINAYNQGSPQSIGDWGKSHWESFGQNESRAVNPFSRGLLG